MSAVEVTITGVLYDKTARTTQPVVLIGEASLTGLGVGGGPMPPGQGGGPGGDHIWGPTDPRPTPPIALPPGYGRPPVGIWPNPPEGQAPLPSHPIALPGDPWWPPEAPKPPEIPPPGSPPVMVPGTQPVNPITPPPAIVVDYPGVGKVLVPQPLPSS